jgi:hypothetical protein
MAKLSKDLVIGTLHPRESQFVLGALGSLNAEVLLAADGASTVSLDLRGTFNLTVEVAGSVDGINWTPIPLRPVNQSAVQYVSGIVGAASGTWVGKCAPFRLVRARASAYTTGTATVTLLCDTALLDDSLQGAVSPLLVTATGVAGAAVTATLPTPIAGLRQYLTGIRIDRFAAAVLTAAATPVVVTTTGLPGPLAFSLPAEAAALGTVQSYQIDYSSALPATLPTNSLGIVCPATPGVIWRATASYYLAP